MFVGREAELARLERCYAKGAFQMVVIYGRRRVGKTTLIIEFCKDKRTLFFTALEQSDADNLTDFSRATAAFFGLPPSTRFDSWKDALEYVADRASRERIVLVLDEFPYAAKRNEALPSIMQVLIDHRLSATDAFLILCGSNQGAMESGVLGSKSPLYGRRTAQMRLGPLTYRDAARMLSWAGPDLAFRYYACVGGVPYYLAQVDPSLGFGENMTELFFDQAGFLYGEPQMLLRQELTEPAVYNSILRAIASGATRPKDIADRTRLADTSLPGYLSTLIALSIVERCVPFGESPQGSRKGAYRIREAAFDFWFRFVMPNTTSIESGLGEMVARGLTEEALATYLGHRFERVCGEWLVDEARAGRLPIQATQVAQWWGTDPGIRERVDIDLIAADVDAKEMVVGECKYRNSFDETVALETLRHRASLVKGYETKGYLLFSKHALSEGTARKIAEDPLVRSVTLADLYA